MRIELSTGTAAEFVLTEGATLAVVLFPDIMGLRPLFDDLAASLAEQFNWTVCIPEIFPGQEHLTMEERFAEVAHVDEMARLRDAVAAAERCDTPRCAVAGFCMGGMYAFKAISTGRFHRAVGFYGMIRLPDGWSGPNQRDALDLMAGHETRVMGIFGTNDPYCPPERIAEFEASGATAVRYEGAEHGFVHDPHRPTHRAEDATDAWRRVSAFFQS